jgi:hypothetical protein
MEKAAAKSLRTTSQNHQELHNLGQTHKFVWTSKHVISPDIEPGEMSFYSFFFVLALDGKARKCRVYSYTAPLYAKFAGRALLAASRSACIILATHLLHKAVMTR